MAITDELREWTRNHTVNCSDNRITLVAIADRIDAEHERAMREEYQCGVNGGYDMGFASADDWLGQHEDAMAEHGWVRLPKDADGEYIHIGDVMEACANVADLQDALAENAKLQELVEYMTPIAWYSASEQERDRMQELGVDG